MAPARKLAILQALKGLDADVTKKIFDLVLPPKAAVLKWMEAQMQPQKQFKELDRKLADIVWKDESQGQVMEFLDPTERRWVHLRCQGLGIEHDSKRETSRGRHCDMLIRVPGKWHLDVNVPGTKVYWDTVKESGGGGRWHKRAHFRTYDCEECGEELDADEALYHWSGLGPYCEACTEADEELCGLKWEARSEF